MNESIYTWITWFTHGRTGLIEFSNYELILWTNSSQLSTSTHSFIVMCHPYEIRNWRIYNLSRDDISTSNGIITILFVSQTGNISHHSRSIANYRRKSWSKKISSARHSWCNFIFCHSVSEWDRCNVPYFRWRRTSRCWSVDSIETTVGRPNICDHSEVTCGSRQINTGHSFDGFPDVSHQRWKLTQQLAVRCRKFTLSSNLS